jgi:4-amino-4-deoxy-L-arabinose transferase-like glycosyltransferase
MENRHGLIVILVAASIYLMSVLSPPSLMDDVDAVQAQIAVNMLDSGDWVTARLNGVKYLEKSPLVYWMMATSFAIFGVHDWAARLPLALSTIALCFTVYRMGRWAFGPPAGFLAGIVMSTGIGLFLFTRILIPDVILTWMIALALWAFLRALEGEQKWPYLFWAAIATGLLLKGLIAALFPLAAAAIFLALTGGWRHWRHLKPFTGLALLLAIAAPWHILATLRNPPYFDLTPYSRGGEYHGFFWFYFLNEHVFRFLNMRHPRDYNTVPRLAFWLFHLLWFFPWSAWLWNIQSLTYRGATRAARTRLLCLCTAGFILVFFTFSTTQEYYSMPAYPAFALLLGCAIAERPCRVPRLIASAVAAVALLAILFILFHVSALPAPGDISRALQTQPGNAYTLSLGHMGDLTLASFAYLKTPLLLAALAFAIGALAWRKGEAALVLMMVLFLNAARLAMVTFDPYLASRPLANALRESPPGQVVIDNQYYTFSSVFFYAQVKNALLLNGRVNNLEYGSHEPGAPRVFLADQDFAQQWRQPARQYLLIEGPSVPRVTLLTGPESLHEVRRSGGKFLFTNHPLPGR